VVPRWRNIAYWQIDASKIELPDAEHDRFYLFIYSTVEYLWQAKTPACAKLVWLTCHRKNQMDERSGRPDTTLHSTYGMGWQGNELILLQLNRPQNESRGSSSPIFQMLQRTLFIPNRQGWVDVCAMPKAGHGWTKQEFVWLSEKDGWNIFTPSTVMARTIDN